MELADYDADGLAAVHWGALQRSFLGVGLRANAEVIQQAFAV